MFYGTMAQAAAQQALRVVVNDGKPVSPDQMASLASQQALLSAQQELGAMAQGLAQIHQQIKAKLPPEPMDPAQATFNAAMAEIERKKLLDKSNQDLKGQELQLKPLLEQLSGKIDTELAMIRERSEQSQEQLRQQVALLKNEQDNRQHQQTELAKNYSDNLTQLQIALEQNFQAGLQRLQEQYAADKAQAHASTPPQDSKLDALIAMMMQNLGAAQEDRAMRQEMLRAVQDNLQQDQG